MVASPPAMRSYRADRHLSGDGGARRAAPMPGVRHDVGAPAGLRFGDRRSPRLRRRAFRQESRTSSPAPPTPRASSSSPRSVHSSGTTVSSVPTALARWPRSPSWAGIIRILAAYAGGAALVDFIPESVLAGFTAGAGVLIAVMQLDEALGLQGVHGGSLFAEVAQIVAAVGRSGVAWPAILLALATAIGIAAGEALAAAVPDGAADGGRGHGRRPARIARRDRRIAGGVRPRGRAQRMAAGRASPCSIRI